MSACGCGEGGGAKERGPTMRKCSNIATLGASGSCVCVCKWRGGEKVKE